MSKRSILNIISSDVLVPYDDLTLGTVVIWDTSTGLKKRLFIGENFTLNITNLLNGMRGDLRLSIDATTTITLPTSNLKGNVTSLSVGEYHLEFVYDGTNLDFNIASYGTTTPTTTTTTTKAPPSTGYIVKMSCLQQFTPTQGARASSCACAKIVITNGHQLTSSDRFKLNYTNYSYNATGTDYNNPNPLSHPIVAIAYIQKGSQKCGCACSDIQEGVIDTCSCSVSGYICVCGGGHEDDYTICGKALSHDSHYTTSYFNNSTTTFTSISGIAGGKNITLDGGHPKLCVWNPTCAIGGTGAKITGNGLPELPFDS